MPPPEAQPNSPVPSPSPVVTPGPPGKARSMGLVILVTIVTFGIWTLVWSYQNGDELKEHNRDGLGGLVYLLLTLIFAPLTMFLLATEIEKMYVRAGKQSPVSALTGLWFLLPIIGSIVWYVKVQGALNRQWESLGAPAASGL
jgi:hypothetical protein